MLKQLMQAAAITSVLYLVMGMGNPAAQQISSTAPQSGSLILNHLSHELALR